MFITDVQTAKPKDAGKKTGAIAIAVIVHAVLALIFALIVVLPSLLDEPEIVAAIIAPPARQEQQMQKKSVAKQASVSSASASAAMKNLMRANAAAVVAAPEVTKTSSSALGLGEGDFGGGFGVGTGAGMGSGATFFGMKSAGKRILFVLDFSGSLSKEQVNLTVEETTRALKGLKAGMQYQVIRFAGGGVFAWPGWKVDDKTVKFDNMVTDPNGKKYRFYSPKKGYADFEFDGPDSGLPKEKWLEVGSSNLKKTIDVLEERQTFLGTDWLMALKVGHGMEPPPDVIYFMSDGTGGNAPGPILSYNRSHGRPVINTFAMQTTKGAKEFAEVAAGTKGKFTIVLKGGDTIDGEAYLKDPSKFKDKIK